LEFRKTSYILNNPRRQPYIRKAITIIKALKPIAAPWAAPAQLFVIAIEEI